MTTKMEYVKYCQEQVGFKLPNELGNLVLVVKSLALTACKVKRKVKLVFIIHRFFLFIKFQLRLLFPLFFFFCACFLCLSYLCAALTRLSKK